MAIQDRIRAEPTVSIRVDSDAPYRPQTILRLVPAPETGSDFTGIDSRVTSMATEANASAVAAAMHHGIFRTPARHSSAAYFATIRRAEIQKILKMFIPLDSQAG